MSKILSIGAIILAVIALILSGYSAITPGPTGDTGLQGPIGLTGEQGPAGEDGIDGINGTDGEQGPLGPTGPSGPRGATGPTGPQGPAGLDLLNSAEPILTINEVNATLDHIHHHIYKYHYFINFTVEDVDDTELSIRVYHKFDDGGDDKWIFNNIYVGDDQTIIATYDWTGFCCHTTDWLIEVTDGENIVTALENFTICSGSI